MKSDDSTRIAEFLRKKFRGSKSFATLRNYGMLIRKFQNFVRTRYSLTLDETIQSVEADKIDRYGILDEFYTYLSEYKQVNGRPLCNSSIKGIINVAIEFLNSQEVRIYKEDLKQRFKLPKVESVYEEGLTKDIIVRLLHNSSPKLQTAILVCASSGMRLGELAQLKISDIDFTTNPTTIRLRKETTKTRETRITCITAEATKVLKDYLKRSLGWTGTSTDDYIFMKNGKNYADPAVYAKAVNSTKISLINSLVYIVNSVPELAKKNENGRNAIHFHALRAWFKTQVTDAHQSDFAEALMGHKSIKLVYYRQNNEARAETYRKVESALTISDITMIEKGLKEVAEKQAELQQMYDGLKKYLNTESVQVPETILQKLLSIS